MSQTERPVNHRKASCRALAALGVIIQGISAPALYAVKEVFAGNHPIPVSEANLFGALSLFSGR